MSEKNENEIKLLLLEKLLASVFFASNTKSILINDES